MVLSDIVLLANGCIIFLLMYRAAKKAQYKNYCTECDCEMYVHEENEAPEYCPRCSSELEKADQSRWDDIVDDVAAKIR